MDALSFKAIELSRLGTTAALLADLPALLENVPEGCSVTKSVHPSVPTKIVLLYMPSKTQLLIATGLTA